MLIKVLKNCNLLLFPPPYLHGRTLKVVLHDRGKIIDITLISVVGLLRGSQEFRDNLPRHDWLPDFSST